MFGAAVAGCMALSLVMVSIQGTFRAGGSNIGISEVILKEKITFNFLLDDETYETNSSEGEPPLPPADFYPDP